MCIINGKIHEKAIGKSIKLYPMGYQIFPLIGFSKDFPIEIGKWKEGPQFSLKLYPNFLASLGKRQLLCNFAMTCAPLGAGCEAVDRSENVQVLTFTKEV